MKSTILTFVFALCAFVATATIHRVNNNIGNNNNANSATFYTTWAAAYSAAAAGDTIIVEPSATAYTTATVTLTKRLTIIGNGFAGWIPAGAQLNTANGSIFHSFLFDTGSAKSYITGLTFNSAANSHNASGSIIIAADSITVQRCRLVSDIDFSGLQTGGIYRTTKDTRILECFLQGGEINSVQGNTLNTNTNIVIKNCILRYYGLVFGATDNNIIVENNILQWDALYNHSDFNGTNVAFNNNIMRGFISNSGGATINNNICIAASNLPTGNGNQNNVAYSAIFNGTAPPTTDDARLKVASVALGTGTGGNDIGAYNTFAGSSTYVQGGVPNFPSLYYFNIGTISNNIMNVTISAKANN